MAHIAGEGDVVVFVRGFSVDEKSIYLAATRAMYEYIVVRVQEEAALSTVMA